MLIGSGNQLLRHHMEIRGLGIIDVQSIFGIRSIRLQKRVEVEVQPAASGRTRRTTSASGSTSARPSILGVDDPARRRCRSRPGKNITVIAEVIALNYLVKVYGGYSPAERLNQHLLELMKRKSAARGLGAGGHRVSRACPALLVTHADLAAALLRAAAQVYGPVEDVEVLSNDGPVARRRSRTRIARARRGLDATAGWCSPTSGAARATCAALLAARGHGEIVVVTGVNLPMLLDYLHNRDAATPCAELAERLQQQGRRTASASSAAPAA